VKPLSEGARACLVAYDWPGNVRELENSLERALVLGSADSILPEDLPEAVVESGAPVDSSAQYHGSVRQLKKQLILDALDQASGSYIEAAKLLGMHPNSLLRLIRNLDLKPVIKAARPQRAGPS
jgi:Nif-specific regulatory protein